MSASSLVPDYSEPSPVDGCYDVFLSFRGSDTRSGFTTYLCYSLRRSGIHTFMDESLLGGDIEDLFKVIAKSRMAVVIYSENFAASSWCLKELEMILQLWKAGKKIMIPIFYKVDVSELKHLTGKTEQYLNEHVAKYGKSTVDAWKAAVMGLGNVSGLPYKENDNRTESDLIENVAALIKKRLPSSTVQVDKRAISPYQLVEEELDDIYIQGSACRNEPTVKAKAWSSSVTEVTRTKEVTNHPNQAASYEYDVFLSFRGDDTRETFTSTLFYSLSKVHKVKTFMDDIFKKGSKLEELLKMIEKSRMSIVIFSENFAESEWCLKELVKILEESDRREHEVLPVFYKVNPSELRHVQDSGKTKEHMDKHIDTYGKDSDIVKSWSKAIKDLGNMSGYTYRSGRGKKEVQLADEIAQEILDRLHG